MHPSRLRLRLFIFFSLCSHGSAHPAGARRGRTSADSSICHFILQSLYIIIQRLMTQLKPLFRPLLFTAYTKRPMPPLERSLDLATHLRAIRYNASHIAYITLCMHCNYICNNCICMYIRLYFVNEWISYIIYHIIYIYLIYNIIDRRRCGWQSLPAI